MSVKRLISGLLAAALLAGLVTLAPASAAGSAAFTDIPTPPPPTLRKPCGRWAWWTVPAGPPTTPTAS